MLAADCDSCLQTRPVTAAMTAFSITTGNITASPGRQSAEEWPSSHWHSCSGPPARSTSLDFYCAIFFIALMIILNFYTYIFLKISILHSSRGATHNSPSKTLCFLGETFVSVCNLLHNCSVLHLAKAHVLYVHHFHEQAKIFPMRLQVKGRQTMLVSLISSSCTVVK